MGDHLGVGLRGEHGAVGDQPLLERDVVLDDPVDHDVDPVGGVEVRVGVLLGHAAVGRPARVADPGAGLRAARPAPRGGRAPFPLARRRRCAARSGCRPRGRRRSGRRRGRRSRRCRSRGTRASRARRAAAGGLPGSDVADDAAHARWASPGLRVEPQRRPALAGQAAGERAPMLASGAATLTSHDVSYSSARARPERNPSLTHAAACHRLPLRSRTPLRRIRVPDDLDAITTTAARRIRRRSGSTPRDGRADLGRGAGALPHRRRTRRCSCACAATASCVLDRAIGHARGNGPDDRPEAPKVPVTTDTPYLRLLDLQGDHRAWSSTCCTSGARSTSVTGSPTTSPSTPGTARTTRRSPTCWPTVPGCPGCRREILDLERVDDREFIIETICDAKPFVQPGTLLAYHAVSGGFILGEIVQRVTGKSIRDVLAEEILDPLGFRWGNYGVGRRTSTRSDSTTSPAPPLLPPLSTLVHAGAQPVDRRGRRARPTTRAS